MPLEKMRIEKIDGKKGGNKIADKSRIRDEGQKRIPGIKALGGP